MSDTKAQFNKHNKRSGDQGELAYEKSLRNYAANIAAQLGTTEQWHIVRTLNIPSLPSDRKRYAGDVDFAIASGNKLVLLDAKNWEEHRFLYSIPTPPRSWTRLLGRHQYGSGVQHIRNHWLGQCIGLSGFSRIHQGQSLLLSQNNNLAVERYRARLASGGVRVSAMVAFLTRGRELNVRFLIWPGFIRSFTDADSFPELYRRLGAPEPVNPAILALLEEMKR